VTNIKNKEFMRVKENYLKKRYDRLSVILKENLFGEENFEVGFVFPHPHRNWMR
jgi:hypothetical protein